jgi:hypothetical protein
LALVAFFSQLLGPRLHPFVDTQRRQRPRHLQIEAAADRFQHLVQNCCAMAILHCANITAELKKTTSFWESVRAFGAFGGLQFVMRLIRASHWFSGIYAFFAVNLY